MDLPYEISQLSQSDVKKVFPRLNQRLDLKRHFSAIQTNLDLVEERIRFQAQEFDPGIAGYIEYACESQGKRIRPALALLVASTLGEPQPVHLDLAVAIELIHLATLVHDDIMDNAPKRRGKPTAYAKWGAELSVLLGDCLFCQALKLCSHFPTTEISRKVAEASNEVCSGEILQTQRRFDLNLSIADYYRIIEMKTAALFRVATESAALLSQVSVEQVSACRLYGTNLGIAYQIYDDCLDLVGTEEAADKTVGIDLAKGKLTLPVLHVLQQLAGVERQKVCEIILHGDENDRLKLLALVIQRGGLRYAVRKIQTSLQDAVSNLQILPKSSFRDLLQSIPTALSEHVAGLGN